MPIPVVSPYLAGRHPLAGHELAEVTVLPNSRLRTGLPRRVRALDTYTGLTITVDEDHILLLPDRARTDYTGVTRADLVLVGSA